MKTKPTKKEKMWDKGEKIYDKFVCQFGFKYSTPRTNSLELFAILDEKNEKELLLRAMMTEFLDNLSDEAVVVQKGKLYSVSRKLIEI